MTAGVQLFARALAAEALVLGFALTAYAIVAARAPRLSPSVRLAAFVTALAWLPSALFHALAPFEAVRLVPALVAVSALAAVALRRTGASSLAAALRRDRRRIARFFRLVWRSPHRLWVALFCLAAVPVVLRPLIVPALAWDTLTYHGLKAGMWVQYGGLDRMFGIGPWAYSAHVFGGGEVFSAWAMLPFRSDVLWGAVESVQWLALGLLVWALARSVGAKEPLGSAAAAFVLSVPTVRLMVGSGYVEVGMLAALVAGLVLGVEAMRRPTVPVVTLSFAAIGVAAGVKLTVLPGAGVAALVILLGASRRNVRGALAGGLLGGLAAAAVVVPWMARTVDRLGLPLSPMPVALGPLRLGAANPEMEWYVDRPAPAYEPGAEVRVLGTVFGSPLLRNEALAAPAGLLLLASVPALVALGRRARNGAWLLAAVGAASVATFFGPDLSVLRHHWTASSSRFLLPAVAVAAVGTAAWPGERSSRARPLARLLVGVAVAQLVWYAPVGVSRVSVLAIPLLALVLGLLGLATVRLAGLLRPAAFTGAAVLVVAAGLSGLQVARDAFRPQLVGYEYFLHPVLQYWAGAVAMVDDPSVPRRIAITSGPSRNIDNWFATPFLGRRLQNEVVYVPISADGRPRPFGKRPYLEELVATASAEAWTRRLSERGVTHVMSFGPLSLELLWMEARPNAFRRVARGLDWGLYRVLQVPEKRGATLPRPPERAEAGGR